MKGIYLASFKALHKDYNIVYQDINGLRDIAGCMLEVDLSTYDYIIATPPCNFYSRANYRRHTSTYSQATKHLLPEILNKLITLDKPFIVENVRNVNLFLDIGLFNLPIFIYEYGRHTYFTNVSFNPNCLPQVNDNIKNKASKDRQGGINVHTVINYWLEIIHQ